MIGYAFKINNARIYLLSFDVWYKFDIFILVQY